MTVMRRPALLNFVIQFRTFSVSVGILGKNLHRSCAVYLVVVCCRRALWCSPKCPLYLRYASVLWQAAISLLVLTLRVSNLEKRTTLFVQPIDLFLYICPPIDCWNSAKEFDCEQSSLDIRNSSTPTYSASMRTY